jgi:microcystin degradation protein MlrC
MRIFTAALGTETNTFSPLPTGLQTYRETLYVRRDAGLLSQDYFALPMRAWRRLAEGLGDTIVESLATFAQPAGRTTESVWIELRDTILHDLRTAGRQDVVLLNLHGAMASEQCDDCEGDLVERVRTIVGDGTVIGVELDLHCHLTDRILANADAVVLYKEYPHTDVVLRAEELFSICRRAALGELRPVMASVDCRMLGVWRTSDGPVRALVDWLGTLEKRPGVLSVSFAHGFPWADVPDVGAKSLAIADNDEVLAQATADEIAGRIKALRQSYRPSLISMAEGVAAATNAAGLIVLADISDNAGGGAASDSTFLLRALMDAGVQGLLFGFLWDPIAVRLCEEAGEGAVLPLRVGGKIGPMSGEPLDLEARVLRIVENAGVSYGDGRQAMGTAVLLDAGSAHILINSIRTQTFHPDGYTQMGIRLADYRVVVAKSAQHFHAGFSKVSNDIRYVVGPGTVSPDFTTLSLPKAGRPLWPQVENPWV